MGGFFSAEYWKGNGLRRDLIHIVKKGPVVGPIENALEIRPKY